MATRGDVATPDAADAGKRPMHRAHRVRRFDASDAPLAAESGLTLPGAATTAIGALSPDGFFATWTRDATGGGTVEGLT